MHSLFTFWRQSLLTPVGKFSTKRSFAITRIPHCFRSVNILQFYTHTHTYTRTHTHICNNCIKLIYSDLVHIIRFIFEICFYLFLFQLGWSIGPYHLIKHLQTVQQNTVYNCATPLQVGVNSNLGLRHGHLVKVLSLCCAFELTS